MALLFDFFISLLQNLVSSNILFYFIGIFFGYACVFFVRYLLFD